MRGLWQGKALPCPLKKRERGCGLSWKNKLALSHRQPTTRPTPTTPDRADERATPDRHPSRTHALPPTERPHRPDRVSKRLRGCVVWGVWGLRGVRWRGAHLPCGVGCLGGRKKNRFYSFLYKSICYYMNLKLYLNTINIKSCLKKWEITLGEK